MTPPAPVEHSLLELAFWVSQIVVAVVAVLAAVAAYLQLRAYKLLEILKLIEGLEIRRARRSVLREIPERAGTKWWDDKTDGLRLETDASDVWELYDILGLMIRHELMDRFWGAMVNFSRPTGR
jgi:hypothetical protein